MPKEEENKEEGEQPPKPGTEPSEFQELTSMFQQQMGLDDRTQAATMLGNLLKEAGVGQNEAPGVMDKMKKTLQGLPQDMSMSRASADQRLSQEIMGQNSSDQQLTQETMQVLRPLMPYMMAFKMIDMFGQQQQGGERSGVEDLILKKSVDEKFGEEGSDKLDSVLTELRRINTQTQQGEMGRDTAIDQLSEQAEKLNRQMNTFGEVAKSMGYTPENQGSLEKLSDVTNQFSDIVGNLRESVPSREQAPEKRVNTAEEMPEPKERPSILSGEEKTEIPVESEGGGEPEEAEAEETQSERPRDEEGRFVGSEETEE